MRQFNSIKLISFELFITFLFTIVLIIKGHNHETTENGPKFLAPLENYTVSQGRDVTFTCVVNHLENYRVAWIKADTKAILALHTHMVAVNQRLSVTHNGHNTWKLHISHVQLNDSGTYMCQVNTDPMRYQSGYLEVVVPPDILNEPDTKGWTNEGDSVELTCTATGVPEPTVNWRREDNKDIVIRNDREKQMIKQVVGEKLILHQVQRTDMGDYFCIASNGVPPSVSKRFNVEINFAPTVKPVDQLVGAPIESQVTLQCIVEGYPQPMNTWYKDDGSFKISEGDKYTLTEQRMHNMYTWQMNITIKYLEKKDFGTYTCASVNAMGKHDERIRLNELVLPPKPTTTSAPYHHTTQKPRRKQLPNHNVIRDGQNIHKSKDTHGSNNHGVDNENIGTIEDHTEGGGRNNHRGRKGNINSYSDNAIEKTRNTQQISGGAPSSYPPSVFRSSNGVNSISNLLNSNFIRLIVCLFTIIQIL